ncbi:MAG: vitamin K epoxide reductase family protein [Anaerolineae bacterium]|nr:vitamin K epoxide reductase family protein [Anaerolineae bacterium]
MSTLTAKLKLVGVDWIYWATLPLSLAGLGVSAYLMWGYAAPEAILACGGSSGCETVKNSVYANLMGIPLPVWGLAAYAAILLLLIWQGRLAATGSGWSAYTALAVFGISLTGMLYSAYLTYLELFVIEAICRWCLASALIMVIIFILSTLTLHSERE